MFNARKAAATMPHQIGSFTAQHDACAAQMGFEFVECSLYFPALVVEGCQFAGRSLIGIEDGGRQTIDRFGVLDSLKPIVDHPHRSEEHTSELPSRQYLVCRLLLEKK